MGWHVSNGHACKIPVCDFFGDIFLHYISFSNGGCKRFKSLWLFPGRSEAIKYLVGQMDKKNLWFVWKANQWLLVGKSFTTPLRLFLSKTFLSASRFTCRRFPKKAFFLRVASHHLEHWRGRFRRRCILLRRQNVRHLCQGVRTASRSSQKCKFNGITEYCALRIQPHCYLNKKIFFRKMVRGIMERSPEPKNSLSPALLASGGCFSISGLRNPDSRRFLFYFFLCFSAY